MVFMVFLSFYQSEFHLLLEMWCRLTVSSLILDLIYFLLILGNFLRGFCTNPLSVFFIFTDKSYKFQGVEVIISLFTSKRLILIL